MNNRLNDKKKNMRERCVNAMGKGTFENVSFYFIKNQIYTYLKTSREKNVSEAVIKNKLLEQYGKNCQSYIFDIDQLIFFEESNNC